MIGRGDFISTATWLALIAVAMLLFVPVMSKVIEHDTVSEDAVLTIKSQVINSENDLPVSDIYHTMDSFSLCESKPLMGSSASGKTISPMDNIVCGYCQLLFHLPIALLVLMVLLGPIQHCIHFLTFIDTVLLPLFRTWTLQSARAPPLLFLVM